MSRRVKAARAAGKVSLAVLVSRVLGLVREQVLAARFGAGSMMDAWLVAFRIPNMLRDLFAEGALSSAFVPMFTRILKRKGKEEAWRLAQTVIGALLLLLGIIGLVFFFFSDFFVYLLASGFASDPVKFELASNMLKVLSPFLVTIALAALAMGMLNALRVFFLPALAPAVFNVCVIVAGLLLVPWFREAGQYGIYAIALGAMAGGVLQFGVQLPSLWRRGFRFRPRLDLTDTRLRKIGGLLTPAVVGAGAVQINILVNTQLASLLGDGPVSWLGFAFRLIYLPIGLFGVAVGVVNLREVSVLASQEDWEGLKGTVANSIKLVSLLALPSTVGLIVLSTPIIEVIFERGEFTALDTAATASALVAYSLGLFAYSCMKIYVPTFYALDDPATTVRASFVAVGANLLINVTLVFFILPPGWKYVGLAIGTSLSVSIALGILAW